MCSVINGGSYYQPHLVSEIKDSSGSTVKKFDPIFMKQTVSSEISADIRSYMQASVQEGTSGTSKVQGYSSGGKTGTAEKLPRGNGKYLVSFITFAPVDDPQYIIVANRLKTTEIGKTLAPVVEDLYDTLFDHE